MQTTFNARLTSLDEMEAVDKAETEKLKAFLSFGSFEINDQAAARDEIQSRAGSSALQSNPMSADENLTKEQVPEVDWTKVGKLYDGNTEVQSVLDREFSRLNKSLELRLVGQDEKLLKK